MGHVSLFIHVFGSSFAMFCVFENTLMGNNFIQEGNFTWLEVFKGWEDSYLLKPFMGDASYLGFYLKFPN